MSNIQNSNYNVSIDGNSLDLINLVSVWGPSTNNYRNLIYNETNNTYNFPYNQNISFNGQIISIVNDSGNQIVIDLNGAQCYYNSYITTTFTINNNNMVVFQLVWGNYWIAISSVPI
jgi:hypothetical protein